MIPVHPKLLHVRPELVDIVGERKQKGRTGSKVFQDSRLYSYQVSGYKWCHLYLTTGKNLVEPSLHISL